MNKFCYVLLVIVIALDSFGFLYPEYFSRMLTSFLPMPVLVVHYFNRAKKPNLIYATSFLFAYLGITLYNVKENFWFSLALVFHSANILIYIFLILKKVKVEKSHIFQYLFLILLILAYPSYFLYFEVGIFKLLILQLYAAACLGFLYSTIILSTKGIGLNKALLSSISLVFSTICSGVFLFLNGNQKFIGICSILFFWLSLTFMSIFIINNEERFNVKK